MSYRRRFHAQGGQIFIEAILIIAALFSLTLLAARYFRDTGVFRTLVQGPWAQVQGMAESGVWAPPLQAREKHPNQQNRQSTVRGEK